MHQITIESLNVDSRASRKYPMELRIENILYCNSWFIHHFSIYWICLDIEAWWNNI